MIDLLEVFADDMQPGGRQQMMDVGHTSGAGILNRDHGELRPALAHGGEGVLEAAARQGRHLRVDRPAGHVRIGPGDALKGDHVRIVAAHFADFALP